MTTLTQVLLVCLPFTVLYIDYIGLWKVTYSSFAVTTLMHVISTVLKGPMLVWLSVPCVFQTLGGLGGSWYKLPRVLDHFYFCQIVDNVICVCVCVCSVLRPTFLLFVLFISMCSATSALLWKWILLHHFLFSLCLLSGVQFNSGLSAYSWVCAFWHTKHTPCQVSAILTDTHMLSFVVLLREMLMIISCIASSYRVFRCQILSLSPSLTETPEAGQSMWFLDEKVC